MNYTSEEKQQLQQDALKYVIPHFASNAEMEKGVKIFSRGEGCYVWDVEGNKYFDSFATLLTTVCGHNRPEITEAVRKQMEELEFFPNYVDTFTVPLIKLAEKLAGLMPGELEVSFFVNSGSEANETALKMARQYHVENGEPHRYKFLARKDSYHATTLGGTSVTGLSWFREYFEPLLPGCVFVSAARRRDCPAGMNEKDYTAKLLNELEETIKFENPATIAGMIMDPLPGSNTGYPLPPAAYLKGVREICDKYGIVLIFDEVQSGFGKTGRWFFCEHENVVPDIMTIGKGFTGGFIPLGATISTPKIADKFRRGPGHELRSGSTYGGHTVACAATIANLEIIEKEKLIENAAKTGLYLKEKLALLLKQYSFIKEVSGIGLLLAIMPDPDKLPESLNFGGRIRQWCWNNGMILRNNGNILVLAPSLIISKQEVDHMVELIFKAIASVANDLDLK
jgi:adenosylmethionine-8-amino-7-oxononanoate aminotransferase